MTPTLPKTQPSPSNPNLHFGWPNCGKHAENTVGSYWETLDALRSKLTEWKNEPGELSEILFCFPYHDNNFEDWEKSGASENQPKIDLLALKNEAVADPQGLMFLFFKDLVAFPTDGRTDFQHPEIQKALAEFEAAIVEGLNQAGSAELNKIFGFAAKHEGVTNYLKKIAPKIDANRFLEQAKVLDSSPARSEALETLKHLAELGNMQAEERYRQTPAYQDWEREENRRAKVKACENNSFCYDNGPTRIPYFGIGYEGVWEDTYADNFTARASLYFHAGKPGTWARNPWSFGIGPDLQVHLGVTRYAASAGIALRYAAFWNGGYAGAFGWAGLSARVGAGYFNRAGGHAIGGVNYQGNYHFIAADVTASVFGVYLGAGIRKEFWPQGQDKKGNFVDSKPTPLVPALLVGIGLF